MFKCLEFLQVSDGRCFRLNKFLLLKGIRYVKRPITFRKKYSRIQRYPLFPCALFQSICALEAGIPTLFHLVAEINAWLCEILLFVGLIPWVDSRDVWKVVRIRNQESSEETD